MCRSRREAPARHLPSALIAAVLLCGAPAPGRAQTPDAAPPAPAIYLLDVSVNGWPLALVARFRDESGRLSLPAEEFDGLGFRLEEGMVTTIDGERWVYLDRVPGLAWKLDIHAQTIDITTPFERRKPTELAISPRTPRIESRADWGASLTYDLFGQWSQRKGDAFYTRTASANFEARLFSPQFTAVTTATATTVEDEPPQYVRLESTITIDNPDAPWRLQLGDGYTGGPAWVRPFRFGGVQWSRNFGLRPDIVTSPMPSLGRNVAVPSTVDLFVNGVRRYSEPVTPGAIRLTDLPISGGANALRVVVTDMAGRRQELVLPLYSSTTMLAKGLSTFTTEAGFARESYALASNDYGGGFASASYGYGLSDTLTLNGYGAAARGYWSGGAGAAITLGQAAMLEAAVMHSDGPAGPGNAYLLSVERVAQVLSLSARYILAEEGFRDLAGNFGYTPLREQGLASLGLNLDRRGQFNVTYARQRETGRPASEVVSGAYGIDLLDGNLHLGASGYAELNGAGWGVLFSANFPLGRRAQGFVQAGPRSGGRDSFAQVHGEAFGQRLDWRLEASSSDVHTTAAQLDWDGYRLDMHLRAANTDGSTAVEAGLVQTLVFMDGGLFVAGRVDDAFTVVETPGASGVRVMLENHYVGRTDRRGRLLVPDLEAYVANSVGIDPTDLDLDASIAKPTLQVAPRDRAGVITRFPIRRLAGSLVTLDQPDGSPPPVGALVTGAAEDASVGYGGEVYVLGLKPGPNRLQVTWGQGACVAAFTVPADLGPLPRLGPFTCAPRSPSSPP